MEAAEPKFARWMRQHGKLAVLKDDEVDRLERAAVASTGYTRDEVMNSMYGRLDPKPARTMRLHRRTPSVAQSLHPCLAPPSSEYSNWLHVLCSGPIQS